MSLTDLDMPTGFDALSKAEQIRYVQTLWDRIARVPEEVPVPRSHLELAGQRLAEYRKDPTQALPADELLGKGPRKP